MTLPPVCDLEEIARKAAQSFRNPDYAYGHILSAIKEALAKQSEQSKGLIEFLKEMPWLHSSDCNHCALEDDQQPCSCGMTERHRHIMKLIEPIEQLGIKEPSEESTKQLKKLDELYCRYKAVQRVAVWGGSCERELQAQQELKPAINALFDEMLKFLDARTPHTVAGTRINQSLSSHSNAANPAPRNDQE